MLKKVRCSLFALVTTYAILDISPSLVCILVHAPLRWLNVGVACKNEYGQVLVITYVLVE